MNAVALTIDEHHLPLVAGGKTEMELPDTSTITPSNAVLKQKSIIRRPVP